MDSRGGRCGRESNDGSSFALSSALVEDDKVSIVGHLERGPGETADVSKTEVIVFSLPPPPSEAKVRPYDK